MYYNKFIYDELYMKYVWLKRMLNFNFFIDVLYIKTIYKNKKIEIPRI